MSQRGCGSFLSREGASTICPLAKDAKDALRSPHRGPYSIVSHPPMGANYNCSGEDKAKMLRF